MVKDREYQMCTRCVMDTTDLDIVFDEVGMCNHCKSAEEKLKHIAFENDLERDKVLNEIVNRIKKEGKGKRYDCIIGLSGGVDSSFLAYKVKESGLRPLAVHLDNGWNSELAVQNIENIVNKLGIDLYTHVVDWEEFRDLQAAYLRSGVIDLEVLSDNAIVVAVYRIMKKYNIKHFIIGTNMVTESIMPSSWLYPPKYDTLNIKAIYKKFGSGRKLKTYPMLNLLEYIYYKYFNGHKSINLLDYMYYNKPEALKFLEKRLDYKPYPGKHYESKITQFYQSYILPVKYNVDKRKAHLSSLIVSGQISRDKALQQLKEPLFKSGLEKENEIDFFCKKLELSRNDFFKIINSKPKDHLDYPSYYGSEIRLKKLARHLTWKN